MAKNKISEYSVTAGANTDISGINIDEGCPPANMNNAIRSLMAALKGWQGGTVAGDVLQVAGGGTGSSSSTGSGSVVLSTSPALTGVPTAPTATAGTSTTQIATTQFVAAAVSGGGAAGVSSFSAGTTGLTPVSTTTGAVTLGGVLSVTSGGTGVTTATGTGSVVRATSPVLTTPNLGTPSAINLTNASGLTSAGIVTTSDTQTITGAKTITGALGITVANPNAAQWPAYFKNKLSANPAAVMDGGTASSAISSSFIAGGGGAVTFCFFAYGSSSSFSNVGNITSSGTSTVYATSSDYRLKENVVPMTGALSKVSQLKPVTYTWKSNGKLDQGFIAHELQAVIPDAVTGTKDELYPDGKPKYQGIDTSFMVATLTAAIQEQQALIVDLTNRVQALEAK